MYFIMDIIWDGVGINFNVVLMIFCYFDSVFVV